MSPPAKTLLRAALIAGALRRAARSARPAAAATPCWKALLNDWYDGRIDNTYAIHCYTDALKHLPPDVATYSSAHDDIERALQSAIAKLGKKKVDAEHADHAAAPSPTTTTATHAERRAGRRSNHDDRQAVAAQPPRPGSRPQAPGRAPGVANKLDPGSADSLPVPLLVLGGLALVLVAAGAGGLVVEAPARARPGS